MDAGFFPRQDSGPVIAPDAGPPGFDAGARDAGFDGGYDSGPPEPPFVQPPGTTILESASFEYTSGSNGLGISDRFWVGWRFEIPAGQAFDAESIGFHNRDGSGTVFGTIVRLSGSTDVPDQYDMTGADLVAAPVTGNLLGRRGHVIIDYRVTLGPGWYAVVFGSEAFGTSATGSDVGPSFGHVHLAGQQSVFSISQSSGSVFQQREGARFFVIGRPAP